MSSHPRSKLEPDEYNICCQLVSLDASVGGLVDACLPAPPPRAVHPYFPVRFYVETYCTCTTTHVSAGRRSSAPRATRRGPPDLEEPLPPPPLAPPAADAAAAAASSSSLCLNMLFLCQWLIGSESSRGVKGDRSKTLWSLAAGRHDAFGDSDSADTRSASGTARVEARQTAPSQNRVGYVVSGGQQQRSACSTPPSAV